VFRGKIQRIHFIGVGGSGMSGIAEVLLTMGYAVTGSDLKAGAVIARLRELGGTIHLGHDPAHVVGADVVVRSTAIPDRNVEVRAAEAAKIPVIPRAEMLGELMRMRYGIAIAGTHGKTTTTSMVARCLQTAGLDPTVVIGGRLDTIGSSAHLGAGEFMVAEADESDGSFMLLDPTVTVVTSVDPEHLDHWGSLDALLDGFTAFAGKVPFFGFSSLCLDHPRVQQLVPRIRRRVVTYGLCAQAEVRGEAIRQAGMTTTFRVLWRDRPLGDISLGMPGRHNVRNALAALSVALELEVPFDQLQTALDGFAGVDRRFSVRAEIPGEQPITIIDDYGHHPVEIMATLEGARDSWPQRRLVAVFQPHRYSRVRDLRDDFARSFNLAGHVVVCPIYRAGEAPIDGLDATSVAASLSGFGHRSVRAAESLTDAVDHLAQEVRPGDVVITLGAGDVGSVCDTLARRLGAPA